MPVSRHHKCFFYKNIKALGVFGQELASWSPNPPSSPTVAPTASPACVASRQAPSSAADRPASPRPTRPPRTPTPPHRAIVATIHEDLNSRENKTCLLLPPKTFGRGFLQVRHRVRDAATSREDPRKFANSLKTLNVDKSGKHYVGQGGLVYRSPSKAGPRHGLAPVWEDGHQPSCVIRGRLRFGVPFDPRFHYDCQIPRDWHRRFPGCHQPLQLPQSRQHANCTPNDNIR